MPRADAVAVVDADEVHRDQGDPHRSRADAGGAAAGRTFRLDRQQRERADGGRQRDRHPQRSTWLRRWKRGRDTTKSPSATTTAWRWLPTARTARSPWSTSPAGPFSSRFRWGSHRSRPRSRQVRQGVLRSRRRSRRSARDRRRTLQPAGSIQAKPGLGPMQITGDGRWLLITNAATDEVHVIDTSDNTVAHNIPIKGKPYQLSRHPGVRLCPHPRVRTGVDDQPVVPRQGGQAAGDLVCHRQSTAGEGGDFPSRRASSRQAGEAGVVAVDPVEGALVYYMEGMTAPMGTFRSLGGRRAGCWSSTACSRKTPGRLRAPGSSCPAPGIRGRLRSRHPQDSALLYLRGSCPIPSPSRTANRSPSST